MRTNKYPGPCRKCGDNVPAGSGNLIKDNGRWVVEHQTCPNPAEQYDGETYTIGGGSGYGHTPYNRDQVYRNSKRNIEAGQPEWLYCLRAESQYISDDGMSFGVGDESGYIYMATCRPATPDEAAPRIAQRELVATKRQASAGLEALSRRFQDEGDRPKVEDLLIVDGERLLDTQDIYGGGSWWVIQRDTIWFVRNNGADGDNWSWNNVRTGGAGAIGWKMPRTAELENQLRESVEVFG
jgi:hypothetical protein